MLTRKVNIAALMCFTVFVCLFVSLFELTRVDTYTEITYYVHTTNCTLHMQAAYYKYLEATPPFAVALF